MTDVGLGEILFTKQAAAQIGPQVVLCRPGCQRPVSGQLLSVSSRGCAVCIQTPEGLHIRERTSPFFHLFPVDFEWPSKCKEKLFS